MSLIPKHQSSRKPEVDPRLIKHAVQVLKEEWQALISLVRFQWPLVVLLVVGVIALLYAVQPLPPNKIRVATGQPESSLDHLGKKYQHQFAKHNIEIELVTTAGAFENVELLRSGKVDATFSLEGMVPDNNSDIVTLGSVEYQPLWLFYRGTEYDGSNPTEFFKNRTLSINMPGSGTHSLSEKILALHGIRAEGNPRILSLSSANSVAALRAGRIDAMFLVAGVESGTIQRLLATPGIRVMDLVHADAYRNTFRFLDPITLPRGGLDFERDIPPANRRLVATTTALLTTNSLHPSIQHLFLSATRRIDEEGKTLFARAGGFPARIAHDLPLSAVAARYYEKGPPFLHGYAPFWIATFFSQIGLMGVALFAIGYPLLRILPNYRIVYAKLCMNDFYEDMKVLDHQIRQAHTAQDMAQLLPQFDRIEQGAAQLWVPSGANEAYYTLRVAIDVLRDQATQRLHRLQEDEQARVAVP